MRWFKKTKKTRKRGPSKSAEVRLKEEKAKTERYMEKAKLNFMREHPTFLEQIIRDHLSMPEPTYGEDNEPQDAFGELKKHFEVQKMIRQGYQDEFGPQKKGSTVMDILAQILSAENAKPLVEAVATFFGGLKMPQVKQLEPAPPEAATSEQGSPPVEEQQKKILEAVKRLMSQQPADVALEIFNSRDIEGDLRGIAYAYLGEYSFEQVMEGVAMIPSLPNYDFLRPVVEELQTSRRREWLALVYDELQKLKAEEDKANEPLNEGGGEIKGDMV